MHRAYLVLFFLFICSNLIAQGSSSNLSELGKKLEAVEANDKEQCLLIIKEIFKELPESQILQFVNDPPNGMGPSLPPPESRKGKTNQR